MEINITKDTLTPFLDRLQGGQFKKRLLDQMRVAVMSQLQEHYARLHAERPNKLGGTRTKFWELAGKSITYAMQEDGFVVDVNKVGVRLHLHGGTVLPGVNQSSAGPWPTKYLTIPVDAAAHGHRAAEFPLKLLWTNKGGRHPWGLGLDEGKGTAKGNLKVLFILAKKSVHQPDPSTFPSEAAIRDTCLKAINDYIEILKIEEGGAA
jgi:hypothetical protein